MHFRSTNSFRPRNAADVQIVFRILQERSPPPDGEAWRGEAALPSLVGKVAHAKRVTDELSSRFRKQLRPVERKIIESQAASFNETVV